MRLLLKILFAPVILILTVFVWLCMGLLYCSAFLFGLAASIDALLGLPMAAVWLFGKMQDFRYWIQDGIYG